MRIAIVGVTGLVGQKMLEVLNEFKFPVTELIPVASKKSEGKQINFNGKNYTVVTPEDAVKQKPDLALFSAGGEVSKIWAPEFAKVGCKVIDNSSAWRMIDTIKLVVPEVNAHVLTPNDMIIANPNCSTIQMVVALAPLHKKYTIDRLIISTYQSITGTGKKAVDQLTNERKGEKTEMAYPHQIDMNCIPHCDVFLENDYTKEEVKLINETQKILEAPNLKITATAVRIPVVGGHSESINVSFENDIDVKEIKDVLTKATGVTVLDNPERNIYPMPINSHGKNDVFVGRIRKDYSNPNTINMWVVADNLRKGAATNAVQIALYLLENNLIKTN